MLLRKADVAALVVAVASLTLRAEILEQVLVKVNGEIFTKTDLEQRQIQALRQRNRGVTPEDLKNDETLRRALEDITPQLLVDAVDEMLVMQQARDRGWMTLDITAPGGGGVWGSMTWGSGLWTSTAEGVQSIEKGSGLGRAYAVAVVEAGKVGSALARYGGFRSRGFLVQAVYDADPAKIGTTWDGVRVRDVADLEADFGGRGPDIVILATPGEAAQALADRLVRLGVKAILNFAPVHLLVPADVAVKNVNMAIELETLSYALRHG